MLKFRNFYAEYWNDKKKQERKQKARKKLRDKKDKIISEAKSCPCTDCKKTFPPEELEFDHLRDKKFNIGGARSKRNIGIKKLLAEIAKCEVVCSECHTKRERARGRNR